MGNAGFFKQNADDSVKAQAARIDEAIGKGNGQEPIPEPTQEPTPEATKKKQNRNRNIVSITLSQEEHKLLKTYAKDRGATVSGVISLWIRQNCNE